jgi:hypothetical protein
MPKRDKKKASQATRVVDVRGRGGKGETRAVALGLTHEELPVVGWLIIISGTYKGQDYRLDDRKYTIGPTSEEDIVVHDDYLSSPHCAIRYENGSFIINDLGSKNKTIVNGEPQTEWELIDNDHIKIGRTEIIFKCL